jgi:hypothetical protein
MNIQELIKAPESCNQCEYRTNTVVGSNPIECCNHPEIGVSFWRYPCPKEGVREDCLLKEIENAFVTYVEQEAKKNCGNCNNITQTFSTYLCQKHEEVFINNDMAEFMRCKGWEKKK